MQNLRISLLDPCSPSGDAVELARLQYLSNISPAERAAERAERAAAAERAERAAERHERAAERHERERERIAALPEGVERIRAHDRYMADAASKGSCRPPSRCPLLALSVLKHLCRMAGTSYPQR